MQLQENQSFSIRNSNKKWIFALKKLISLAQKYPSDFKKIVDKNIFIREKIENGLKEYNQNEKNIQMESLNKKPAVSNLKDQKPKEKKTLKIKINFE